MKLVIKLCDEVEKKKDVFEKVTRIILRRNDQLK